MKRWRKHIICLLMLTVPLSLWAAAPGGCEQQAASQANIQMEHESSGSSHAHPGSDSMQAATALPAEPRPDTSHDPKDCDCCGDCLEACAMASTSALQARQFESSANCALHYSLSRDSQLAGGPDYPSRYRPPIAQI